MAITWSDVTAIAPSLSSVPIESQAAILAIVAVQMNAASWGALYDTGATYLAAHLGTLAMRSATGGGAVTSESVGSLSRSYATPQGLKGSLGLTSFGAEYARLVRLLPVGLGQVP